ncbi:VWA domain-containing protein [Kiloniella laminariae]|uniref:VWA domain-containing protein n=1 Tax=Kiloniella laminariae TaxID=454162 RepID=A0ABT4LGQ9_9PROT|nr:vWA domain-containing protein [Kiloniella laminariae]MCZ4280285.1 VWA domain-containing protein [Kiloniella laminariae]
MFKSPRFLFTSLMASVAILSSSTIVMAANHENSTSKDRVEVAFVLDTTGSMADLIDGAKRKIWSIANTIVDIHPDADIRMALIGYRDIGDDYVVKPFPMNKDIQGLYGNLVRFEADGGGDTPEAVNEALNTAVRKLDWDEDSNTQRIIFLVGDAPPHMDYANAPQYPEIIEVANKKGIIINAVQAGEDSETRDIWKEIAQRGHGRYIPIPQDGGKITIIETPFDNDIIILQRRIDETVIPYGSDSEQSEVRSKMTLKSAAPEAVQVENSKFYAKRSAEKEVITGGGDLVADVRNDSVALDKIEEKQLPEDLQGLSLAQKQDYLKEKLAARAELEQKMALLIKKHDDYIAEQLKARENAPAKADSFDQVVTETLREQLK